MLTKEQIKNRLTNVAKILEIGVARRDTSYNLGLADAYQAVLEMANSELNELLERTDDGSEIRRKSDKEIKDKIDAYGEVSRRTYDYEYSEAMQGISRGGLNYGICHRRRRVCANTRHNH